MPALACLVEHDDGASSVPMVQRGTRVASLPDDTVLRGVGDDCAGDFRTAAEKSDDGDQQQQQQ